MRRAQESGLGTGANVFLTKPMLRDFDRLFTVLMGLGLGGVAIAPAAYTPTPRGRRYELMRPELDDLRPVAELVLEAPEVRRDSWSDLASCTEAAWVRRSDEWDAQDGHRWREPQHHLVCRTNLDLYSGTTGAYLRRHGNLRRDGAQHVLDRAFGSGPISEEAIYFGHEGESTSELAARWGNSNGTRVYFDSRSVRYRWLDRASGHSLEVLVR